MNKTESLQLKGIAILMMLFLHLFNTSERVELCDTFINFWNGKPLVLALSRVAAFCVPIYLFISGYGLAETCKRKGIGNMHPLKRIFKLYVNFWIVFLIFIPLGHYLRPEYYTGDCFMWVANFFAVRYDYNNEWWFLFPYFMLVLGFRPLIRLISRLTPRQNLCLVLFMFVLHVSINPILKATGIFPGSHLVSGYFSTLTSFTTGVMFAHYNLFPVCAEYLSSRFPTKKNMVLSLSLVALLILRMMLGTSVINPLFIIPFVILSLNINFSLFLCKAQVCRVLRFFGKHSTNMWLTHTFFAYYLFHDFIYGMRYPILIYAVLIVVSLLSAWVIGYINAWVVKGYD